MEISVKKYTDAFLMRKACEMTMHDRSSKASLKDMYKCEHSPIRTQMFWIEMLDIPTFVSVHFVRHHVGIEHFVQSNRVDHGADTNITRLTPINHGMWCNAQALISMSRRRLCYKASPETREVMLKIKEAVRAVDPDLANALVPNCIYRGGHCHEPKPCGNYKLKRDEEDETE